jgi:hypothetical protein
MVVAFAFPVYSLPVLAMVKLSVTVVDLVLPASSCGAYPAI